MTTTGKTFAGIDGIADLGDFGKLWRTPTDVRCDVKGCRSHAPYRWIRAGKRNVAYCEACAMDTFPEAFKVPNHG